MADKISAGSLSLWSCTLQAKRDVRQMYLVDIFHDQYNFEGTEMSSRQAAARVVSGGFTRDGPASVKVTTAHVLREEGDRYRARTEQGTAT